jgi:hypothetical protein
MSGQIFISYRREDASHPAGRLYDRLSAHFTQSPIFMDVDNIPPGIDFVEAIEKSVASCDALIAVIGKRWLSSADDEGRRRLDNPEDFVRLEVATALKRGVRVIPVLVEGALMPRSSELPDDLKPLARRNALNVSHERFRADSKRLIDEIEQILAPAAIDRHHPVGTGKQPKRGEQEWVDRQSKYFESFDVADANADGPEVLKQRFSNLWWPYEEDIWSATVTDGAYKLVNSKDPMAVRYVHFSLGSQDMSGSPISVEVKVDVPFTAPLSGAGIICRFDPGTKGYYACIITAENRFAFYRREKNGYMPLYLGRSNKIHPGQFNTIAVTSREDCFRIYINDECVKAVNDAKLETGDLGIIAMGRGTFYFDNLAIYNPE